MRKKPRVIIATPGRLIDHLGRKSADLSRVRFLVLDETDRMLDMGFIDDMRRIVATLPVPRQTLLFSATLPPEITTLSQEFLTAPVRVQIGAVTATAENVLQEAVYVSVREKLPQLLHELNTRAGSILVFVKTKHGAERLAKELKRYGQKACALHGELRQNRRRQIVDFFRAGTVRVLVATDLAARGLDVPQIAHVINYDLPQSPEDYLHRIGRTGRAGAAGSAISFLTEERQWKEICRVVKFETAVKICQKSIDPLPTPKFLPQEEGSAPKRRKTAKKIVKPAPVRPENMPVQNMAEKAPSRTSMRQAKKPKTFRKAVQSAQILTQQQYLESLPFHAVTVGLSKKMRKKLENEKKVSRPPVRNGKHPFAKRFKRKRK